MKMLSLLKGIGGERSLASTLGRWMQSVSRAVDALNSPKRVIVWNLTPQVVADLAGPEGLIPDTISADEGVPYDVDTGLFSLDANSTYELFFYALFQDFNTVATDVATVVWLDSSNNPLPVAGVSAACLPPASTVNTAPQPVAHNIIKTTAAMQVHAVAVGGTGSASMGRSYAIVRKIGSTG